MTQNLYSESFVKIAAAVLVGQAGGAAITIGLAALIFSVPLHRMAVPYALFMCPGIVFAPLLYWARISRANPRVFETRSGIALSVYGLSLGLALVLSAMSLGVAFRRQASVPEIVIVSIVLALITIGLFGRKRQRPGTMRQDLEPDDQEGRKTESRHDNARSAREPPPSR